MLSFAMFTLFAYWSSSTTYYEKIGLPILFSRGAAGAILLLIILTLFFVAYDLQTWCRSKFCKTTLIVLVDEKTRFHKFCGYLLLAYAILHSLGHLSGSMWTISSLEVEETNAILTHKQFKDKPTYLELLMTLPGITGFLMLVILSLMGYVSTQNSRKSNF